jgi:hypothetical protein
MSDQIRVNGNAYSWGSIAVKIGGEPFYGFTAVSYGDKRERSKGYGMGRHQAPRLRSRGRYTTDPVKLAGPKGTVQELRAMLASSSADGVSYGDVEFLVVIQYVEATVSGGETPITVELERCVISADVSSDEEGPDFLKDEIELDCMLVRRNGLTLFDSSIGSP